MRIFGGTVVADGCARSADVVVEGGKITAVAAASAAGDVDARGCVVLPGGIDPHTHPLADLRAATFAAARGGTTTIATFTSPHPGETPAAAFVRARDEQVPHAIVNVALHAAVWEPDRLDRAQLEQLRAAGGRTVKLYLAYPELGMAVSDRTLYETLRDASRLGMLVLVHCESIGAIEALVDELLASGRIDVRAFVDSRPPLVEEEGVARALAFARLAAAPVYLVHLTSADSLELVRAARRRGQQVWAEVCTHHLVLDDSRYDGADAERFVVVPPLRARAHVEALWAAIADGTVDAIGSDHAQVKYQPEAPPGDFRSLPYGVFGIDVRVPLVLTEGTRRGIGRERLVELLAGGPARAFGLRGKGTIQRGADADVVLWDPEQRWTIEGESPFSGIDVAGAVRRVFVGGREGEWAA